MTQLEERILIYTALAVICSFIGVFVGASAGALTLVQIAAVIEALFWFGLPKPKIYRRRQQRILFNRLVME